MLNGTLRDDEGQPCQNCMIHPNFRLLTLGGEIGHRRYDCPQIKNFNANVVCHRCGQAGHFARDCKVNLTAGAGGYTGATGGADFDKEYQELMAEVGGGGGGGGSLGYGQPAGRIEGAPAPWAQPVQQVASAAPWVFSPSYFPTNHPQKAAAPWASAAPAAPPPPPAAPAYQAPAPPPGMSSSMSSAFGPPPSLGPPPGLATSMGIPGMPPPPMGNGFAPPPPPGVPPPPPGASFPPPPPGAYPPPPPPGR